MMNPTDSVGTIREWKELRAENAKLRELVKLAVHCFDSTPHLATLYDCEEWEKCGGCGWRRFRNDACALLEEK